MKSKDNMVAWVKNHAKLPERIDKNEYELTRWSTTIHQVIVMETSQTYDDNKQLSKDIVNTQTDSDGNITNIRSIPMKLKDNLVAWVKNHAKLPERIDKDEYE